jgi:hypothetical protein
MALTPATSAGTSKVVGPVAGAGGSTGSSSQDQHQHQYTSAASTGPLAPLSPSKNTELGRDQEGADAAEALLTLVRKD